MKYNYLERYNLNNIIKEAVGVNFSSFKDIENTQEIIQSGILNTINFEDISNISQNDFEDILSTKKIIEKFDKDYNVVQYFFFYNKRLFIVLLSKDTSSGVVSIDFKSTGEFSHLKKNNFNEFKNIFINKSLSFTFERIAHEDSKDFWKYIILCLKIYVKKYNDNYFNFVGSQTSVASRAKIKQTNYILIKKILDDFEALLYSNLQKMRDKDIGISKEKLNDIFFNFRKHYIEYFNKYYNIFKNINNDFLDQLSEYKDDNKLKNKINDFLDLKKQIEEDLKEIQNIIRSEKSNIKQRKNLDKYIINLNNFYKKWAYFIELLESKSFNNQLDSKNDTINYLEVKLLDFSNLICFVILFRSYFILNNLKIKFNEKQQIQFLKYLNKANSIFNFLVKKYNFNQKAFWEMQSEFFDIIKEEVIELQKKNFYLKEEIKQAIDNSLKTMVANTDNFELENDYENKLNILINLNFQTEPVLQKHIQNFLENYMIFFKSINNKNSEKRISNLIKFNERGIQSFLNSREKLYYRALESYSKTEPNLIDILYNGSMLFFKINK
jgi:hypothetical protein